MAFKRVREAVYRRYTHVPMASLSTEPRKRHSPRAVAWLFVLDPICLHPYDYLFLLITIKTSALLLQPYALAQGFQRLITQRRDLGLYDHWVNQASKCAFPEVQRFTERLRQDEAAIQATLTQSWSNGFVEGKVLQLKLVRRMMYGRGDLELLKRRLLLSTGDEILML